MATNYAFGESVHTILPDEPRLLWDVVPGVSIRVHGSYRRGQKAGAYQPLYYGPFLRPQLWLMGLPRDKKLELGGLIAGSKDYPHETPWGVVADWLMDHEFPDWQELCEPEPDCEWTPSVYRDGEWRLLPLWMDDITTVDKTFCLGDPARTGGVTAGKITRIDKGLVQVEAVGSRGGRKRCGLFYQRFAEANRW